MKLFDFLLQQSKAKALYTDTHEGNILEQVKIILSKAVDAYHSPSGMLATNKVDILMLSAGAMKMLTIVLNQRIRRK